MFQNTLPPTEWSDYSRTALEYGIYIAKTLDARLTGLHVIDIKVLQGPVLNDICSSASLSPFFRTSRTMRASSIARARCGSCTYPSRRKFVPVNWIAPTRVTSCNCWIAPSTAA